MSLEITKNVGLTVVGVGLLAGFAAVLGMSNGHIFTMLNQGMTSQDGTVRLIYALMLTGFVSSGVVGVAMTVAGALWTKDAVVEYMIEDALQ